MGRINIEVPDELHDHLRAESGIRNVPIKMLVIDAIRTHCEETDLSELASE